ncbi:MAG: hypothetical protein LBT98_00305 [Puniceicoccales bacterium]|jgi:hypothetical protein|nr:hypothetical protein [Puniceicoccales bacterium]
MSGPVLLLDGAAWPAAVGLLGENFPFTLRRCRSGATVGALFAEVEALLASAGLIFADVSAFLLCRGPGQAMGLRLCRMLVDCANAIGPERPVLAYDCLELGERVLLDRCLGDFTVAVAVTGRSMALRDSQMPDRPVRFVPLAPAAAGGPIFFLPSPVPTPAGGIPFSPGPEEIFPFFANKLRQGPEDGDTSLLLPPPQFSKGSGLENFPQRKRP